ncbi:MAG: ParB/RepB/Spo0J family partition protein [Anaerolineales bacterium]|nr:ParB/RepB/Spo0J family partition protein [Anaerolineales bacterium]
MSKKTGLGKGLEALIPSGDFIPETTATSPAGGVTELPVASIQPNPRQPRAQIDDIELAELAASIRENGVLQPIIVTIGEQANQYILIAGERRWRASKLAGISTVPAIVRQASDLQRLELALVENIQRADLAPLEAAEAYRQLIEEFHLSHEEIATKVGKSRVAVTNTLRLLKLPAAVHQALSEGKISEGHARALLTLSTSQAQIATLHTILRLDLNVRQTEELVRKLSGVKPEPPPKPPLAPEISSLEERLRNRLGTKVSLNPRRKGGTLVIHYYSDEELNSLVQQIIGDDVA